MKFEHVTRIGGYPLIYIFNGEDLYCADCAQELHNKDWVKEISKQVYWEGETLECGYCKLEIEAAYGNVEE